MITSGLVLMWDGILSNLRHFNRGLENCQKGKLEKWEYMT
jgi:hypothetical protein